MLAKIRSFITENVSLLSTQLDNFQANVETEANAIRKERMRAALTIVRIGPTIAAGQKPFEPGQLIVADNTNAQVNALIAAPRTDLIGQPLCIVVRATSANVVKVIAAPPKFGGKQGLIDGGSSFVNIAAAGLYIFMTDGQDWWF